MQLRKGFEKLKQESVSICIIASALLLCVWLSVLGAVKPKEAEQAAARPEQMQDPLLLLVNQEVALPKGYQITPQLIGDEVIDIRMYRDLTSMFDAAAKDDVWFWVVSGYRSAWQQEIIFDREVQKNLNAGMSREQAQANALRTVQRPGHSEHQTGLAVDLNDVSDHFETSKAYKWLTLHAAEYGFVQRYLPEKSDLTGIDKESWHFRYVGKAHAKAMTERGLCLEEYVDSMKNP